MHGKENEWLTMNAGRRIAPIGSAEIWDVSIPILGGEDPDLDGCRRTPSNCPEYLSCEDYHEQEEFYE